MIGTVALDLGVLGGLLAVASLAVIRLQPDLPAVPVYAGLVGGLLCIAWAVLIRRGVRCRLFALGTVALVAGAFFAEVMLLGKRAIAEEGSERDVLLIGIVAIACCISVLIRLARVENVA